MKIVAALFGGILFLHSMVASAIVPFKPIRTQIYNQAKSSGLTKNMVKPSLRLTYSKDRTTVTARLYSIGTAWPTMQKERMLQEIATFKVSQLIDGQIAVPVKQNGQVWHAVMRLN
jgi:hypothetical protein